MRRVPPLKGNVAACSSAANKCLLTLPLISLPPWGTEGGDFFLGEERAAQKGEPIDIGTGKDSLRETGIEREIPELRE